MVSGQKSAETTSEGKEFKKKIGFVQAEVVLVAPSNKEIKEEGFYVYNEDEEPEYTGEREVNVNGSEDKEEVKFVRIPIYLRDKKTGENINRPKVFYIYNYDVISKANPENKQYINEQGLTTYAKSKDAIPAWFTKDGQVTVRPAKKGEKEFYEFIRAYYNLKWSDKEDIARCIVDIKDLFKAKFTELKGDMSGFEDNSVIVNLTIRQKDYTDKEGAQKTAEVEEIYNAFAPGNDFKFLSTKKEFSQKDADNIRKEDELNKTRKGADKKYISNLERVVLQMTDPSYGCKDTFYLGLAKDYSKDDFVVTSSNSGNLGSTPSADGDDY